MLYKKPAVFDLEGGLRSARGSFDPGCISGSGAGEGNHLCSVGTGGTSTTLNDCTAGADPSPLMRCITGGSPTYPGCVAGGQAVYECSTGSNPFYEASCIAGPSGPAVG